MASVEFSQVSKVYPDHTRAIMDFSMQISDGEFMVLVGPSGCGKSTALRMLAGLETITAGEILINDEVVNYKSPQQRNIAMVFQNYALYPHMTVRQNLEFPLRMRRLSKKEMDRQVNEAAELLGLVLLLDRKPKNLSGGQRQRVAMGRAIVRNPDVFLMDEPLSNLDAKLRVQIRSEIAALQHRMATTTLYVTHDQIEAMTLGDRVAVICDGKCQQVASPKILYDRPANTFVAGFIGSPGMNIMQSLLHRTDNGHLTLEVGGQKITVASELLTKYQGLTAHLDQPIYIGIRPEALLLDERHADNPSINVRVSACENHGNEALIYFNIPVSGTDTSPSGGEQVANHQLQNQQAMAARVEASYIRSLESDTMLSLGIETSRLYFFTLSGEAIL